MMKQKLIDRTTRKRRQIHNHIQTLPIINETSRQKSIKYTEDLNNIDNYLDLIDIYLQNTPLNKS